MDSSLRTTRVMVGSSRFQIQTDLTDRELSEVVQFVDEKLAQYENPSSRVDLRSQMILMALDISSELFELRRRLARADYYQKESQRTAQILIDLIESSVGEEKPPL
ncbi:MAG: cell division protein ZapA [Fibrobacter sp.]|nr:cell division protein ZapA [Fibrobacter sp.]